MRLRIFSAFTFFLVTWLSFPCLADDPSSWGGLYRSRDGGATWFPVDAGLFIGAANALAISPVDPNHLLYGTDTRLLRSINGGRDWIHQASNAVFGPIFAVAFSPDGRGALVANASSVFYTQDLATWQRAEAPPGSAPASTIMYRADRIILAGAGSILTSFNGGRSWERSGEGLPNASASALLAVSQSTEELLTIAAGSLWLKEGDAPGWRAVGSGLPPGRMHTLALDSAQPSRLWAAGADQVFKSDDAGKTWQAYGERLPEPNTAVRAIAAHGDGQIIILTTSRGLLRTTDAGQTWLQVVGNLPSHLEAGPLVRDPSNPDIVYAGFSLRPYSEQWRFAEEVARGARLAHQQTRLAMLLGGAALVAMIGVLLFWRLRRRPRAQNVALTEASKEMTT